MAYGSSMEEKGIQRNEFGQKIKESAKKLKKFLNH
jgi:hypothetical protein